MTPICTANWRWSCPTQRRFEEAWQELDLAGQLDPQHCSYFLVRAHVLCCQNRIEEAKQDFRQVVAMSVDNELAISEWIELCQTIDERRQVLAFVKDQLVRQVIFGDGLLAFRTHARHSLEAAEVLALLEDAWRARPDLWQAWSALIGQQLDMNRVDQAWELACQATDRFPLVAPLWLARAELSRVRGDSEGEQQTLETACQIAPNWGDAVQALSALHERRGDYARSQRLLESYLVRNPLDVIRQLRLAGVQWQSRRARCRAGRRQRAVQAAPGFAARLGLSADVVPRTRPPRPGFADGTRIDGTAGQRSPLVADAGEGAGRAGQQAERLAALDRALQLDAATGRSARPAGRNTGRCRPMGRSLDSVPACRLAGPPAGLRCGLRGLDRRLNAATCRQPSSGCARSYTTEPYFYEAWSQLAEWYEQARQPAASLEAAEVLVRIRPHSEISFGYLGTACLAGNRTGAIRAFERRSN